MSAEWVTVQDPEAGNGEAPWQIALQESGCCTPLGGLWFYTEGDALRYLREVVLTAVDGEL